MRVWLIISVLRIGLPYSISKQIAIVRFKWYSLNILLSNRDEIQNNSMSIFALVEISRYDVLKNSNKLQLFEALSILGCIGMS